MVAPKVIVKKSRIFEKPLTEKEREVLKKNRDHEINNRVRLQKVK